MPHAPPQRARRQEAPMANRIIVVDDCSPEPPLSAWLAREAKEAVIDYNSNPPYMTTDGAFQSAQRPQTGFNYLDGGQGNGPGTF